jgi:hypothetical protein
MTIDTDFLLSGEIARRHPTRGTARTRSVADYARWSRYSGEHLCEDQTFVI